MPRHCCVPKCTSNYSKEVNVPYISTFAFPKDEELKRKWIAAIQREHSRFIPTQHSVVCAKHFLKSEIIRVDRMTRDDGSILTCPRIIPRLKPTAIPTVFSEKCSYKYEQRTQELLDRDAAFKVPQSIKQENVNCYAAEPDLNFETTIFDSMEIKLEPIKIKPYLLSIPKTNNLVQNFNSTEEAKMIENNDKCMIDDCGLNEICKQKGSMIKLEESKETEEVEKMEDVVDFKWKIENNELDIKNEINIEDGEQGLNEILSKQKSSKIKVEESEAIDVAEKMDGKWAIENEELNIKKEENIEDEEHGLNEILSKQKSSEIKLEESEAIDVAEKMDVKWEIENEELNIKQEENIEDEEHGY